MFQNIDTNLLITGAVKTQAIAEALDGAAADHLVSSASRADTYTLESIDVGSRALSTFSSKNNTIRTLRCTGIEAGELLCNKFETETLYSSEIQVDTINADTLNADILTSINFDASESACDALNVSTLNCNSVTSKYYETDDFTTRTLEIIQTEIDNLRPIRVASTIQNGRLDTVANYKIINNTPSLFSDLQLATNATGSNTLFIYGDVINSTTSLPRIIGYNSILSNFDNGTSFGGKTAYLSLASDTSGSPKTLRYERDGKLTIYSNTGTIFWQSTNVVSDIREKIDIVQLDNCLAGLQKINGYYFNFIGSDEKHAGLVAQEVLEVFPEAVIVPENCANPKLSVKYESMIPALIQSLKEISADINELIC
jgi:Chaperone of endosialidase